MKHLSKIIVLVLFFFACAGYKPASTQENFEKNPAKKLRNVLVVQFPLFLPFHPKNPDQELSIYEYERQTLADDYQRGFIELDGQVYALSSNGHILRYDQSGNILAFSRFGNFTDLVASDNTIYAFIREDIYQIEPKTGKVLKKYEDAEFVLKKNELFPQEKSTTSNKTPEPAIVKIIRQKEKNFRAQWWKKMDLSRFEGKEIEYDNEPFEPPYPLENQQPAYLEQHAVLYEYWRNEKNIFYKGQKIPQADYASFEPLSYRYSKDKNNVYYNGKKIAGADAATFGWISNKIGIRDKNYIYFAGKRTAKNDDPHWADEFTH